MEIVMPAHRLLEATAIEIEVIVPSCWPPLVRHVRVRNWRVHNDLVEHLVDLVALCALLGPGHMIR
jgi:hypothetical protein